ncbi:carboxypeptidase-like regulatory domain-containing protein [Aquimarina muelleri]|uniref:carboxypeptidase-like regulatory domain-containing protein n=1 Tax=Aquimarina muelleri TaxID=279356 RepID=UPI003F684335
MLRYLLVIIYISTTAFYGQEISLSGVVKDSVQSLSNVNIIAKPRSKEVNLSFSITNEKGEYTLLLQKDKEYTITISYLGYDSHMFKFNPTQDAEKNIVLHKATEELDEVIIIEEIPMLIKKDTIIYDVKAFTDGKEHKLKNILKKLPGVEVEKNGEVTVNGKKVTKMMVEGGAFFGGSSKLAVENIPANAVDNVEVLDNYSEVGFLKNFVDSDEMAMNITLKEDKKNFAFGDITSGGGEDKHYESHAALFYYSPKTNMNFIGDLNDTGKKSFTINDYMSFEGGRTRLMEKDGASRTNSIQNYTNLINNQPVFESKNKFSALHISSNVNTDLTVSGYGIYADNHMVRRREIINDHFFENSSYREEVQSGQEDDNILGIAKFSADYSPNFKEKIFADLQVKIINNESLEKRFTSIGNILTDFDNENKLKGLELQQDFEWHKKHNSKHTTSLVISNTYNNTAPKEFWNTNRPIFDSIIPLIQEERFNLKQNIDFTNHTLDIVGRHYWVLASNSHLYITLGNKYLNQEYITKDFQVLEDNTINDFENSGFNNDLDFRLNDVYLGTHFKFKTGVLTVKTGGHLHHYDWKSKQEDILSNDKFVFLPDVTAKLELKPSENLTFTYRFLSNFTDAPNYANRFRLLDYNKIIRGNSILENETYQNGSIRYSKFAMYNGLIFNGLIDYKRKNSFIRNQIQIEGIDQFLIPVLQETPETIISGIFNLRKKIKKINLKVNARMQYATFQKIINTIHSEDTKIDINLTGSVTTRFKKWPNIELGYRTKFSMYDSNTGETDFVTNEPFGNIEYTFLKNFTFTFDYRLTEFKNRNTNTSTTFDMSNISLFYKKENSPFGFEISGSNIFHTQFKQNSAFSDFLVSDTKDFIIPSIFMFTIHYKL